MDEHSFHMSFRNVVSVSLLFAALEKSFPLFRSIAADRHVDIGGNQDREKIFHTLKEFSTSFPHSTVEAEH